jgi:hypothetical protein
VTAPTAGIFSQYSDVTQLISPGGFPNWVPAYERERIAAYQVFEEMYWTHEGTFDTLTRGTDDDPVIVPTARIIVNTLSRYAGKGLRILANPLYGTPAEQQNLQLALEPLLAREAFLARFQGSKKMALIQGDQIWHIIANPGKLPGTRVSLKRVDPGAYFPVPEEFLEEGVYRRVHIAEQWQDPDDESKVYVERLTYTQMENPDGSPGAIFTEAGLFETEGWDGSEKAPELVEQLIPPTQLDARITAIPVYHFKNSLLDDGPWGNSVVRGLSRLMASINQSNTDEDLALALEGLGVYATESGAPVDENGDDTDWWITPGRVLENVKNFRRVEGVSSVQPFGDHIDRLTKYLFLAADVTEAAIGNIDPATAESGIARMLKLAPTLESAREINEAWKAGLTQFFYDLNAWLTVYEATGWGTAVPLITFADPAPVDRKAAIDEILQLVAGKLMSVQTAVERLAELGVVLAADEVARLASEAATAAAMADPYAARLGEETDSGEPEA